MGIKNMFKKSSKIFDREGFYVVLFICLCIVAVTAVYISKNNGLTAKKSAESQKQQEMQQPNTSQPQFVEEDKKVNETPVLKQEDKKVTTAEKETAEKTASEKGTTNNKSAPSKTVASSISLKLDMPVAGEIVKKFDKENLQFSNTMQQWETHEGVDIACDLGSEVKASANGKVVDVLDDNTLIPGIKAGYGLKVIIDHENGLRTVYCNLDPDVKVKKGDTVKKGQVIGATGDTAIRESVAVEGSHLHFIVLKKSGKDYITVDPQDFLH